MKVQVELRPDVGEALRTRAEAEGLSLDQFAARALEALARPGGAVAQPTADQRVKAFDEFLAGLESDAALPEGAFQRENWYSDRQ